MQSTPIGTPRASTISGETLAAGRTPPWPGFAPCDSLTSIILTCGSADRSATFAASKPPSARSEEHTSELQSLMRISYAVFCLKKKKNQSLPTAHVLALQCIHCFVDVTLLI